MAATVPTPTTAPVIVAPTNPPTHDFEYHPDHPGPLGRLIYAIHLRLIALETEIGLREAPKPITADPVAPPVPVGAPVPITGSPMTVTTVGTPISAH